MKIKTSSKFKKQYQKLPELIKKKAKAKEIIFRDNIFDPRLKTHKLAGKDKECWAFWVDRSYRIKFIILNNEDILFLEIGLHNIYK